MPGGDWIYESLKRDTEVRVWYDPDGTPLSPSHSPPMYRTYVFRNGLVGREHKFSTSRECWLHLLKLRLQGYVIGQGVIEAVRTNMEQEAGA